MPPRNTSRKPKSKPKTRPAAKRGSKTAKPATPQRNRDIAALVILALGIYLGFVLYAGWDGAIIGAAVANGLVALLGKVAYLVPVALGLWALAEVTRPLAKRERSIGAGGILVVTGLLLAFAAQTFGLGGAEPARGAADNYFQSEFYRSHGGLVGESLYWVTNSLVQRIGAHVLSILLVVIGLLLISGSTIAEMVARSRERVAEAGTGARERIAARRDTFAQGVGTFAGRPDEGEAVTAWDADTGEISVTKVLPDPDPEPEVETGVIEWEDLEDEDETVAVTGPEPNQFAYEADDDGPEPLVEVDPAITEDNDARLNATLMGRKKSTVTMSEEIAYTLPERKLLERSEPNAGIDDEDHERVAASLLETLKHFGVDARMVGMVTGPHVSRYELQLAPGTKVGKIAQLKDDLAYALASTDIRILAPIPGKKAVGVEVPNQRRRLVRLGDIYDGKPKGASPLTVWLGEDVSGHAAWTDVAAMPHVLVAGTTGSGKSGCVNAMLSSILMHASPNEVRLVLVDPKQVELNHYEKLPHLLTPVVTSPRKAANVLQNLIVEMESRYGVMSEARARNLVELNRIRRREGLPPLPQILCVIDELADLMMVAPSEVEDAIIRLAQKSRAVGIHLVLATQRPSTDIITGTIKVNIPARIAFAVASQVDSRVILDGGGAESLLGQGDMLFRPIGTSKLGRIQGAFITEDEIARITDHWANQGEPEFDENLLAEHEDDDSADGGDSEFPPDEDDLLEEAARIVVESQTASVSGLQRRLRVGYTRAGRLIDMLERRNIISGYEGSKPRQVLVSPSELPRVLAWISGNGDTPPTGASTDTPGTEPATAEQEIVEAGAGN